MADRVARLTVNGRLVERTVADDRLLRDFLRDDLGLTGTKEACEDGMCGACSVHLDGAVIKSCLYLAALASGHEVTTIEGLADGDRLHPVQQAMIDCFGFQCGFCTPGFIMTAAAVIDAGGSPSADEWRDELVGNICRCTGYTSIVRACMAAAASRDER